MPRRCSACTTTSAARRRPVATAPGSRIPRWCRSPAIFSTAYLPCKHQHRVRRDDVHVSRDDLVRPPIGSISRAGFDNNVEVCVRYLAAWLDGQGCVPIHWLMEDAATAEIARAQLWQWLHCAGLHLDDGTPIDVALFERALIGLPARLAQQPMPGADEGRCRDRAARRTHPSPDARGISHAACLRADRLSRRRRKRPQPHARKGPPS